MSSMQTTTQQCPPEVLQDIAQRHLGFETLESRHTDSLDFRDVSVRGVRAALEAAYRAGLTAGAAGQQDEATKAIGT